MMSDTPPSSPSGGVSTARPRLSPSPATAGAPSVACRGTASTLSDVVGAGLQPLRVQLIAVATSVDDLVDSVRDVLVKVEVLSRSQERLAQAVHTMGTTFTVGFKDVLRALEEMSNAADGRVSSPSSAADQTLTAISTLKMAFRENEKKRIISATRSAEVYNSTNRTWDQVIKIVMTTRRVNRAEAKDWLLSTVHLPTRRNASVLAGMRACVPVLRTKPHLMQSLKDLVCSAFLLGVGLSRAELKSDLCKLWLEIGAYMAAEMGLPSMVAGTADMLRFCGGGDEMISEPAAVGGRPIIRCLLGHFALACCFVRSMLEAKAGLRPRRRSGLRGAIYEQWESELARADAALPRDNGVHNCLIITDGDDPNRGVVDDEDDASNSDVGMEVMEGADNGAAGGGGESGSGAAVAPEDRGGGMLTEFAAEVLRLHTYKPPHNVQFRSTRLVDGADPRRSKLEVVEDALDEEYLEEKALDLAGLDLDILASLDEMDV
ncbi:hypothetical protein I4F81_005423 [Pyropia yezoensis]|uniref:Uncharacterized protein n=1 Tax=Pyropia yezoensis TaxID=2788 RepID=A0ACC3BYS6_PYRYE|nr:hypothetical protein I4F81_005423 [Neopyropia yezoensis]